MQIILTCTPWRQRYQQLNEGFKSIKEGKSIQKCFEVLSWMIHGNFQLKSTYRSIQHADGLHHCSWDSFECCQWIMETWTCYLEAIKPALSVPLCLMRCHFSKWFRHLTIKPILQWMFMIIHSTFSYKLQHTFFWIFDFF